jgi:anti-sigma B factor antagonist
MTSPSRHDDQLHVERRLEGTTVVIRAAGEVDVTTAPLLKEHLRTATDQATPLAPLVADLRDVRFLGSHGIAVLVEAGQRCQQHHITLRLVATRPVTRPLGVLGMQDMFTLCPTLAAALNDACLVHERPAL